ERRRRRDPGHRGTGGDCTDVAGGEERHGSERSIRGWCSRGTHDLIPVSLPSTRQSGVKIDSIDCPKSSAILKASGRLGSYLPFSRALTVCRETCSRSARSAC